MTIDIKIKDLEFSVKGEYFPEKKSTIGFVDTTTPNPSIGGFPGEAEHFSVENIWWNRTNGDSIHITKLMDTLDIMSLFSDHVMKRIHNK